MTHAYLYIYKVGDDWECWKWIGNFNFKELNSENWDSYFYNILIMAINDKLIKLIIIGSIIIDLVRGRLADNEFEWAFYWHNQSK